MSQVLKIRWPTLVFWLSDSREATFQGPAKNTTFSHWVWPVTQMQVIAAEKMLRGVPAQDAQVWNRQIKGLQLSTYAAASPPHPLFAWKQPPTKISTIVNLFWPELSIYQRLVRIFALPSQVCFPGNAYVYRSQFAIQLYWVHGNDVQSAPPHHERFIYNVWMSVPLYLSCCFVLRPMTVSSETDSFAKCSFSTPSPDLYVQK